MDIKEKNYIQDDVSVVILAAGFSSRMNHPKALVEIKHGVTFLDALIETYSDFGCSIYVVVNSSIYEQVLDKYDAKNVSIVLNSHPEYERFYSIQTGLCQCETGYCFLQNVDNPVTEYITLQKLYMQKQKDAYMVPVSNNKGGHPVLFGTQIINGIIQMEGHDYNLRHVLQDFKRINVKVDKSSIHQDINSTEELLLLKQSKQQN